MFCTNCGNQLDRVTSGGCGGHGSVYGCPKCDSVITQTDGGMFSGGRSFERDPYASYKILKYNTAKRLAVRQVESNHSPHFGKWCWTEVATYESHYYKRKGMAERGLKKYVEALFEALPNPICEKCNKKTHNVGYRMFKCDCGRRRIGNTWIEAPEGK